MDFNYEIIGTIAAILTTISFVPQVAKIWKQKSAENVSLSMYLVLFSGLILWLTYGFLIDSFSIKFANSITLVLVSIIIYFKLKYK